MSSLSTKDMQGKKLTQKSKLLWYPSSSQQGNDSKSIIVKENTCNRAIFLVCMGTALSTGITACCYSRKKHTWLTFASYTFVTGGVWKSKMKWILKYFTIEEEAQAMKAHVCALRGLPQAVVLQTERCERSKFAKGQKLCYLMESQTDSIYGTGIKICYISVSYFSSDWNVSFLF